MATRIAKLSRTVVGMDVRICPEGTLLMVPEFCHVHHGKHGCKHHNVEEGVQSVPLDQEENERWQCDAGCDSAIRIQVPCS